MQLKRVGWDKPIRVRRVHDTSVLPADHQGFPLLLLPHGLPESVYQVAEVVAIWMTGSHMLGTPYGFKLACGQHSFAERCAMAGYRWSAKTIYRALQTLTEDGDVDVLRTDDGESVYRRCSTGAHHHHLVCRSCGRTVEVDGPTVERWADTVSARHGFRDVTHTLEIFGTCADCSN